MCVVDLLLVLLVILVGVKIVVVISVGMVIIVVFIGVGGYGECIVIGLVFNDSVMLFVGVIFVVVLVLFV